MHIKLGELDHAASLCAALSEQQGLSAEQKSLLAQKETEIEKARRSKGAVANKKASVWQQRLDQAQLEQLEAK